MKKTSSLLLAVLAAGTLTLSAADIFAPKDVKAFASPRGITVTDGKIALKTSTEVKSAKLFPYNPAKKYSLSCKARIISGKPGLFYLCIVPYDAKGKQIDSASICCTKQSQTTLAAPLKKGDTTVKIADGSKWDNKSAYDTITFGAKQDLSDLPNRTGMSMVRGSVTKGDGCWEIKLQKPAAAEYPAGTAVRQQYANDSYVYIARKTLKSEAQTLAGKFSGLAKEGLSFTSLWAGTAKIRVLILHTSSDKSAVVEVSELKLTEE